MMDAITEKINFQHGYCKDFAFAMSDEMSERKIDAEVCSIMTSQLGRPYGLHVVVRNRDYMLIDSLGIWKTEEEMFQYLHQDSLDNAFQEDSASIVDPDQLWVEEYNSYGDNWNEDDPCDDDDDGMYDSNIENHDEFYLKSTPQSIAQAKELAKKICDNLYGKEENKTKLQQENKKSIIIKIL